MSIFKWLTIAQIFFIALQCATAQTTATYDNVRARQQLTVNQKTVTAINYVIDVLATHSQLPTAKAVYDYLQAFDLEAAIPGAPDAAILKINNAGDGVTIGGFDGVYINTASSTFLDLGLRDTAVLAGKIARSGATTGQVLQWSGTAWVPATPTASKTYEEFDGVSGTTITTANTIPATEKNWRINLYRDGVRLRYLKDYSISGSVFTLYVSATSENFTLIIEN